MTATEIPSAAPSVEPDSAPLPPQKYTGSHSVATERFPTPNPKPPPILKPTGPPQDSPAPGRQSAEGARPPGTRLAVSPVASPHCICPTSTPPSPIVVRFRDYAVYCRIATATKGGAVSAIVAQLGERPRRRPETDRPLVTDQPLHCRLPARSRYWQRLPMRVTLKPTGAEAATCNAVGTASILEEGEKPGGGPVAAGAILKILRDFI